MKKLLIAIAATLGFATASFAGDFDNTQFTTTLSSGSLVFTLENTVNDPITELSVGANLHSYSMGKINVDLFAELGYNRLNDTMNLRGEYQLGMPVNDRVNAYGAMAVDYVAASNDLSNGDFYLDPYVGASYSFTENTSVYAEVGYTWNISQSWAANGGYAEVGVDYYVTDRWMLTPSLVRTFDTGNDSTQARIGASVSF